MGSPAQNLAPAWERIGRLQHANQVNNADSNLGAAGSAADVRASVSILDTLHAIGELKQRARLLQGERVQNKAAGQALHGTSHAQQLPSMASVYMYCLLKGSSLVAGAEIQCSHQRMNG